MRENDDAWRRFFLETSILEKIRRSGFSYISAKELKEKANREPRLMAKQDTLSDKPDIFIDNEISILPTKNGEYVLFSDPKESSFFKFSEEDYELSPRAYYSESDLSIYLGYPESQLFNEAQSLDFAIISSLFKEFSGEGNLRLTSRGRIFSKPFTFNIPSIAMDIPVSGVQIELDGGYENERSMLLIEAKIGKRSDFNIRQLYYPFLQWKSETKRIIPIFMVYTNSKYYFFEFDFSVRFGDVNLVKKSCFTLNQSPVTRVSFRQLLSQVQVGAEPSEIPFPQADDFDKVIDTLSLALGENLDKQVVSSYFGIDERQGDYYLNATRYLRFLEKKNEYFVLSESGEKFVNTKNKDERNEFVLREFLSKPIFREALLLLEKRGWDVTKLNKDEIVQIILTLSGKKISGSTPSRRADTLIKWLLWLTSNYKLN